MQEHMLRAFLLEQLDKRGMNTMKEVSSFCRAYNMNPDEAAASLGFNRPELLGRGK
jgi:hypothetical protein